MSYMKALNEVTYCIVISKVAVRMGQCSIKCTLYQLYLSRSCMLVTTIRVIQITDTVQYSLSPQSYSKYCYFFPLGKWIPNALSNLFMI